MTAATQIKQIKQVTQVTQVTLRVSWLELGFMLFCHGMAILAIFLVAMSLALQALLLLAVSGNAIGLLCRILRLRQGDILKLHLHPSQIKIESATGTHPAYLRRVVYQSQLLTILKLEVTETAVTDYKQLFRYRRVMLPRDALSDQDRRTLNRYLNHVARFDSGMAPRSIPSGIRNQY